MCRSILTAADPPANVDIVKRLTSMFAVALTIAGAKGLIIVFVFMELARGPSLKWVFAGTGFFWLMFLFELTMIDYVTRNGWPTIFYG